MMKLKKLMALMMVAVMAMVLLTACGGGSSESETTEAATEAVAEAETEAVEEVVEEDTEAASEDGAVDASILYGTWRGTAFMDTNTGESYDLEEYAEKNNVTPDDITVDYIFAEDGTVQCVVKSLSDEPANGTYTFDGLNVDTSFDNGTAVHFELDDSGEVPVLVSLDEASGISTMMVMIE